MEIEEAWQQLVWVTIGGGILLFLLYLSFCAYLFHSYQYCYGKRNFLTFVPLFNLYYLGKLVAGPLMGWGMISFVILSGRFELTIHGETKTWYILPPPLGNVLLGITGFLIVIFVVTLMIREWRSIHWRKKMEDEIEII